MIKDQRHMSGSTQHETVEQVQQYWREFAAESMETNGFMFSQRRDAKAFRTSRKVLQPRLEHSRWVGRCPMDGCNGGVALWRENPQACCLDCGTIFTNIKWPSDAAIEKVESAMLLLPFPERRHWFPEHEDADEVASDVRKAALVP